MPRTLEIILGPTAVGKTGYAIARALEVGSPVISCDSRQIYQGLTIGTAAPSKEELAAVPHYFIGTVPVTRNYTAGIYEMEALELVGRLFAQGHEHLVMCGGSMLYIDAFCYGLDDFPEVPLQLRRHLMDCLQTEGVEVLAQQLKELDPVSYEDLERPREQLYERINARVEQMVAEGLEGEARAMLPYRDLPALQTVGYREFFEYFDGKFDLETTVRHIQASTRHYAKRQLTWWRRDSDIRWVDVSKK